MKPKDKNGAGFLQLMSELVLSARLCLLIDWILLNDAGGATLNHKEMKQKKLETHRVSEEGANQLI